MEMNVIQAKELLANALRQLYSVGEIQTIQREVIEKTTGLNNFQQNINPQYTLNQAQSTQIQQYLTELLTGRPLQYVLGEAYFYDMMLKVNEHVLIPRPETEELVHWVKEKSTPPQSVLDIGSGSGCISISLKKIFPNAEVYALDVSEDALQVLQENVKNQGVEINPIHADIFHFNPSIKFDLIISNPPYVPEYEKLEMQKQVLQFEPHWALFVPDNNPTIFYTHIANWALKNLNPGGSLYFECHYLYATQVKQQMELLGYTEVELRQDLSGKNRMLKGIIPPYHE